MSVKVIAYLNEIENENILCLNIIPKRGIPFVKELYDSNSDSRGYIELPYDDVFEAAEDFNSLTETRTLNGKYAECFLEGKRKSVPSAEFRYHPSQKINVIIDLDRLIKSKMKKPKPQSFLSFPASPSRR